MDMDEVRIWIGCLACYNNGRLVGYWYEALEGDEVTTEQIHEKAGITDQLYPHEELWVFDHEGFGGLLKGECSPSEAARLAQCLEEVEEDRREAFCAWVGHGNSTDAREFNDHYHGHWDSEKDYAESYYEDSSLPEDHPLSAHIDWDSVANEMFMDGMYSLEAPGGGVFVFSH